MAHALRHIYVVHIYVVLARYSFSRRNSVHGHSKLHAVQWLGLSVTVGVKVRARVREWVSFLSFFSLFFFLHLK